MKYLENNCDLFLVFKTFESKFYARDYHKPTASHNLLLYIIMGGGIRFVLISSVSKLARNGLHLPRMCRERRFRCAIYKSSWETGSKQEIALLVSLRE